MPIFFQLNVNSATSDQLPAKMIEQCQRCTRTIRPSTSREEIGLSQWPERIRCGRKMTLQIARPDYKTTCRSFRDRKSRPLGKISSAWIEAVVDGQKREGAFAGVMIWRLLAVGGVPSLRELCLFSLDAFCLNLSTENLRCLPLLPVADRPGQEEAAPPSHLSNTLARQVSVQKFANLRWLTAPVSSH